MRSRLCARVSVCKGVCVQGCRCARLWSQAFEHRCGHPRAKGSLEARPQRQRTLKAERRPLLLRLAATTAISAAISAATVVDVAARTTARPRARLERRLHLQREHECAQPRRLRRGDLKQRRGAAGTVHRDEPPAREKTRPRRRRHARISQAEIESPLAARDAVELRGDRGARLLVEAPRAHVPQQQHVERRTAGRLQGGVRVCAGACGRAGMCEGVSGDTR